MKPMFFLFILCSLIEFSSCNYRRDAWLRHQGIDPDFAHYTAMRVRSAAARIEARTNAGMWHDHTALLNDKSLQAKQLRLEASYQYKGYHKPLREILNLQNVTNSANSTNTISGNSTADGNSTSDDSDDDEYDSKTSDDSGEDEIEEDDEQKEAKLKAYTDISDEINNLIPDIKAFLNGFIHGSNTIKTSTICQSAMIGTVDDAVNLINVRWFWIPEYLMKF